MIGQKGYASLQQKYAVSDQIGITDSEILSQTIEWEKLREAQLITPEMCDAILTYDKAPEADQMAILNDSQEADRLSTALHHIFIGTSQVDISRYVLLLIFGMLEAAPATASLLTSKTPEPCDALLKLLQRTKDDFIIGKAAAIVGLLISTGLVTDNSILERFNTWVIRRLTESKGDGLVATLFALKYALKNTAFQKLFVASHGVNLHMTKMFKSNSNHRQVLYIAGFCFWLLSFNKEWVNTNVLIKAQLMQALVLTLNDRLKPKIVRIILSAFENLLHNEDFRQMMVMKGLVPVLESLEDDKWEDADIAPMIKSIHRGLEGDVKVMSSYEKYVQELKQGQLQEGPVHTAQFWKENAHKFEVDEFQHIKDIVKLLSVQEDNDTVGMACYDLGEWARFYPDGRKIVDTLGGKDRIMLLLSHDDKFVQKKALLAIQKLLVTNWEGVDGKDE